MLVIKLSKTGKTNKKVFRLIISEKSRDPYRRERRLSLFFSTRCCGRRSIRRSCRRRRRTAPDSACRRVRGDYPLGEIDLRHGDGACEHTARFEVS